MRLKPAKTDPGPVNGLHMVDFVSAEFDAILPRTIRAGTVMKLTDDGEVEWETSTRLSVKGSWDTSVQVRAVSPSRLEISGNLAKFLQGHNLYGPSDLPALIRAFLERVQPVLWPEGMPYIEVMGGRLSRVDCTSSFILPSLADVLTWVRAAEQRGNCSHRGRGVLKGEGTLVYGDASNQRAKDWQLTFYSKGLEIGKRPLPLPMMCRNDVLDFANKLLRCEVRVRTAELKRLNLRTVENWQPETCAQVWQDKLDRIDFSEGEVMACSSFEGVKARLLDCYDAWQAGRDLRQGRSKTAFYRLRREMQDTFGVDIVIKCPKSNVLPLRRSIVALPAQRPPWADEIAALLAA